MTIIDQKLSTLRIFLFSFNRLLVFFATNILLYNELSYIEWLCLIRLETLPASILASPSNKEAVIREKSFNSFFNSVFLRYGVPTGCTALWSMPSIRSGGVKLVLPSAL